MKNYNLNLSVSEVHLLYSIIWSECVKLRDFSVDCDLEDSDFVKRVMNLSSKVSCVLVQCNLDEKYEDR